MFYSILFIKMCFNFTFFGINRRERGQSDVYYTVPKSYDNVFLFVGLITLGTLENWLVNQIERFNNYFSSTEGAILCIIIGDIHPFIGHCLIPLDL